MVTEALSIRAVEQMMSTRCVEGFVLKVQMTNYVGYYVVCHMDYYDGPTIVRKLKMRQVLAQTFDLVS